MNVIEETEVSFGGKAYRVRPTFRVISRVESETDQAARVLGSKMFSLQISVTEMAAVMSALLRDHGGPTAQQAGEIIVNDGYEELVLPVGTMLAHVLRGHKRHMEEAARQASGTAQDPPTAR